MNRNILKGQFGYLAVIVLLVFLLSGTNAFADVILDNGDPGITKTGSWYASGGSSPYGGGSEYARPDATYTWSFDSQPPDYYEVFMWWSLTSTRGSNIAVDINHSTGTETVLIDQTADEGQWNSLGIYLFDSYGSVTITATSEVLPGGRIASTCADAISFISVSGNIPPSAFIDSILPNSADVGEEVTFTGYGEDADGTIAGYRWESSIDGILNDTDAVFTDSTLSEGTHTISFTVQDNEGEWSAPVEETLLVGNEPIDIIIDNGESGTSYTGTWPNSSGPLSYGTTSVYARPDASYTWPFASPHPAGVYEVYMWWTAVSSRGDNVSVDINTGSGIETVTVDQTANGGQWNSLGTFFFDGDSSSVTVIASNDLLSDGRIVSTCADAVRFVLQ